MAGLAVLAACAGKSASEGIDEPSKQPFIDKVKAEIAEREKDNPPPPDGTFIEQKRQEIVEANPPSGEAEKSFIESVKEKDPEYFQKPADPSYTEVAKSQLDPTPEKGAIERVKDGTSELELKRPGDIRFAAGLRVGAVMRFNATGESGTVAQSFTSVYPNSQGYHPNFSFFWEWQPFHSEWLGSLGLMTNVGFSAFRGNGVFEVDLPNEKTGAQFGSKSRTVFAFVHLPISIGLNYRFNLLRILRPYVMVLPTFMPFLEERNDGQPSHKGYSLGLYYGGGIAIQLDRISDEMTWNLYDSFGIKHYYLNIEYAKLTTIKGAVRFDDYGVLAGLTFEY
ncbi:MAG: hypothetical protein AB7P04_05135 [Bacteriovoracia bacterium]